MEKVASENQREIPSPGTQRHSHRQSIIYLCQRIFEESKDGHWDQKEGSFPSKRDNPYQRIIKEITELEERRSYWTPDMKIQHSTILWGNILKIELHCGSTMILSFYTAAQWRTIIHIHKAVFFVPLSPYLFFHV